MQRATLVIAIEQGRLGGKRWGFGDADCRSCRTIAFRATLFARTWLFGSRKRNSPSPKEGTSPPTIEKEGRKEISIAASCIPTMPMHVLAFHCLSRANSIWTPTTTTTAQFGNCHWLRVCFVASTSAGQTFHPASPPFPLSKSNIYLDDDTLRNGPYRRLHCPRSDSSVPASGLYCRNSKQRGRMGQGSD